MSTPSLGRSGALAIGLAAVAAVFLATGNIFCGSAFAQTAQLQSNFPQQSNLEHTILVSGTASTKAVPDRAIVTFAVETRDTTAGAALAKNSQAMNRVLDALKGAGVQQNETSTAYFNIFPIYNYTQSGNVQSLQGYTVTNSLTVSSANTGNVSSWIDAAVHGGANRVDNVQFVFSSEKMAKIQSELIENAIGNAKVKADTIAAKLGVQITGVQSIVSVDSGSVPGPFFAAQSPGQAGTPIVVGGQEVSASVSIAYTIR